MDHEEPEIASFVSVLLAQAADEARAEAMAAYMKSDMPFYGVPSPVRKTISRTLRSEFPANTRCQYEMNVRALWRGSYREERYLSIAYARSFPRFVTLSSVPVYRMMIRQGAWWDFVDEIASHLVGTVLAEQRDRLTLTMEAWTMNTNMWLRRTSILSQLRHKNETDTDLLDMACTSNLDSSEFFIRKAIGWALREYAKTDPQWVSEYVARHQDTMSGLTHREAMKHLR